jgi:hypothetical protein
MKEMKPPPITEIFLQENAAETTKQNEEKREKT